MAPGVASFWLWDNKAVAARVVSYTSLFTKKRGLPRVVSYASFFTKKRRWSWLGGIFVTVGQLKQARPWQPGVVSYASFFNKKRGWPWLAGLCRARLSSPRNKDGHGCVVHVCILHLALANECRRSNWIIHSLLSHHGVVSPTWQLFLAKTFAKKADNRAESLHLEHKNTIDFLHQRGAGHSLTQQATITSQWTGVTFLSPVS